MSSNNVDIEISGFDFEQTNKLAATIKQKMEDVPGAEDINISRDDDKPELQLFLNQDKLSRHGLTTTEVANALRNRVYGYKPTKYKEDGEEYDVIVRLQEKYPEFYHRNRKYPDYECRGRKDPVKRVG